MIGLFDEWSPRLERKRILSRTSCEIIWGLIFLINEGQVNPCLPSSPDLDLNISSSVKKRILYNHYHSGKIQIPIKCYTNNSFVSRLFTEEALHTLIFPSYLHPYNISFPLRTNLLTAQISICRSTIPTVTSSRITKIIIFPYLLIRIIIYDRDCDHRDTVQQLPWIEREQRDELLSSGHAALRNILNIHGRTRFFFPVSVRIAREFNETERPPISTTFLRDYARLWFSLATRDQ